jgi:hypothetical protein
MTDQPVGAHRPAHAGAADGPLALLGNPDLLGRPLLALFCSRRCPGSVILKTYDAAKALRAAGIAVIGGFQTPVERDCLAILLRGEQPVVICPARSLAGMRLAGPIKLSITHKCLGDCRACRASIARLPRCQRGGEILTR